ncbi:hypothetical protein WMY93_012976 [Mugilogobius chulae]|uniref:Uncharacterized protein n=1 Tax=Mugilogobius chulae TaxID=88201 RepID=A0AAW0P7Y9_9GOBI
MKFPGRTPHRIPLLQRKKRGQKYTSLMFKARKEVGAGGTRISDFFLRRSRSALPRPVLLRLVGAESSRLSKTNRLKTVTLRELQEAIHRLRQRSRARPAA